VETPPAAAAAAPAADPPAPAAETAAHEVSGREPAAARKGRKTKARKADADGARAGKLSALDGAAKVLAETGEAMTCQELIGAMAAKGYWASPGGKTPHATLYSAITREINTKADAARFHKAGPGRFARTGAA
jgi:hypothetical protein